MTRVDATFKGPNLISCNVGYLSMLEALGDAVQEPGMPLDTLSRWTRQAPLQALAVAFLVGVLATRRRGS
jgi:hypothetical protein